jgi:hypothetical protein
VRWLIVREVDAPPSGRIIPTVIALHAAERQHERQSVLGRAGVQGANLTPCNRPVQRVTLEGSDHPPGFYATRCGLYWLSERRDIDRLRRDAEDALVEDFPVARDAAACGSQRDRSRADHRVEPVLELVFDVVARLAGAWLGVEVGDVV